MEAWVTLSEYLEIVSRLQKAWVTLSECLEIVSREPE